MERLTRTEFEGTTCEPYVYGGIEHFGDSYGGEVVDRLSAYEDTNLTPEQMLEIDKDYRALCEKMERYKKLEEQGLLLQLPCKVGDTVWGIRKCGKNRCVQKGKVSEMYFDKKMRLIIVAKNIAKSEIGKNVFLSESAAQEALERMVRNG